MPKILALLLFVSALPPAFAKEKYQRDSIRTESRRPSLGGEDAAQADLEEKVGQVFMIWCRARFLNVESPEYLQFRDAMRKYHVGSFAMSVPVDGPFLLRTGRTRRRNCSTGCSANPSFRCCLPRISSVGWRSG
jgi:hypothetical protein